MYDKLKEFSTCKVGLINISADKAKLDNLEQCLQCFLVRLCLLLKHNGHLG